MRKALPILVSILERETRGWFLHFRERLIAELRAQKMPDEDIEKVSMQTSLRKAAYKIYSVSRKNIATLRTLTKIKTS